MRTIVAEADGGGAIEGILRQCLIDVEKKIYSYHNNSLGLCEPTHDIS